MLFMDMNSYVSIRALVEHVNSEFERLDVAVLTARLVNRTNRKLALLLLLKLRAAKLAHWT